MKELNSDIRRYSIVRVIAFLAMIAALAGIFCLYMSDFYPVYVNGVESIFRHILRYAMYGGLTVFALISCYEIDYAEQKLKKLKKLRKKKLRGR